jgi:hypothetical protein
MGGAYNPIINSGGTPDNAPTGSTKVNGMFALLYGSKGVATPSGSSHGSPTNNYDPTGNGTLAQYSRYDLNPSAAVYLSGLLATGIGDEKMLELRNVSTYVIVLGHLNTNSSAGNRFYCPGLADLNLLPGQCFTLKYWAGSDNVWVVKT